MIDIRIPSTPLRVGAYDTPGDTEAVAICGNYAYVGDDRDGLLVIDVSDPIRPMLIGRSPTAGNAGSVVASSRYVYVTESAGSATTGLKLGGV